MSKPQSLGRVYGKGTVHIPQEIRKALRLDDGDMVVWTLEDQSKAIVTKARFEQVRQ